MTEVLFNHLERCHGVLIFTKYVVRGTRITKVLFNHLERCHGVLIFPKYVVRETRHD